MKIQILKKLRKRYSINLVECKYVLLDNRDKKVIYSNSNHSRVVRYLITFQMSTDKLVAYDTKRYTRKQRRLYFKSIA